MAEMGAVRGVGSPGRPLRRVASAPFIPVRQGLGCSLSSRGAQWKEALFPLKAQTALSASQFRNPEATRLTAPSRCQEEFF